MRLAAALAKASRIGPCLLPHVSSKGAAEMEDKTIHDFFGLDLAITWQMAEPEASRLNRTVHDLLVGL